MAIRHLTGSTQLITMINRFGHGAAASQLQEMEVHLAEEHLRAQSNHDVFLPESLQEGSFTTFCWDNNDICEETLSGRGTTHRTNGIAIQRRTAASVLRPVNPVVPVHVRHRSVSLHFSEVLPYNAGARCNLPEDPSIDTSS